MVIDTVLRVVSDFVLIGLLVFVGVLQAKRIKCLRRLLEERQALPDVTK